VGAGAEVRDGSGTAFPVVSDMNDHTVPMNPMTTITAIAATITLRKPPDRLGGG